MDISFTVSSSSTGAQCQFTRLTGVTTAPGSRSGSTLWNDIGGTQYISQACTTTSVDLGTNADADLKGILAPHGSLLALNYQARLEVYQIFSLT